MKEATLSPRQLRESEVSARHLRRAEGAEESPPVFFWKVGRLMAEASDALVTVHDDEPDHR